MIITVVLVVLALAVVGYVLVGRMKGQPVKTVRLLMLPVVLTAIGALQLGGAMSAGFRPADAVLLAIGLLAAAGLGAARGATAAVLVQDGAPWLRYRPRDPDALGGDRRGADRADPARALHRSSGGG